MPPLEKQVSMAYVLTYMYNAYIIMCACLNQYTMATGDYTLLGYLYIIKSLYNHLSPMAMGIYRVFT